MSLPIFIHCCTACDGMGGMSGEGTWWSCDGCEGSGETSNCAECGDPMSRPEADRSGHHCEMCLDAEDRAGRERALLRGVA